MNMISAERLLSKNETGAPRAFMKESMELRPAPYNRNVIDKEHRNLARAFEEFL